MLAPNRYWNILVLKILFQVDISRFGHPESNSPSYNNNTLMSGECRTPLSSDYAEGNTFCTLSPRLGPELN